MILPNVCDACRHCKDSGLVSVQDLPFLVILLNIAILMFRFVLKRNKLKHSIGPLSGDLDFGGSAKYKPKGVIDLPLPEEE